MLQLYSLATAPGDMPSSLPCLLHSVASPNLLSMCASQAGGACAGAGRQ